MGIGELFAISAAVVTIIGAIVSITYKFITIAINLENLKLDQARIEGDLKELKEECRSTLGVADHGTVVVRRRPSPNVLVHYYKLIAPGYLRTFRIFIDDKERKEKLRPSEEQHLQVPLGQHTIYLEVRNIKSNHETFSLTSEQPKCHLDCWITRRGIHLHKPLQ